MILREHAQEFGGQRIELHRLCDGGGGAGGLVARNDGAGGELAQFLRIGERRIQRGKARADGVELLLVTGQFEQRGRVTTR